MKKAFLLLLVPLLFLFGCILSPAQNSGKTSVSEDNPAAPTVNLPVQSNFVDPIEEFKFEWEVWRINDEGQLDRGQYVDFEECKKHSGPKNTFIDVKVMYSALECDFDYFDIEVTCSKESKGIPNEKQGKVKSMSILLTCRYVCAKEADITIKCHKETLYTKHLVAS